MLDIKLEEYYNSFISSTICCRAEVKNKLVHVKILLDIVDELLRKSYENTLSAVCLLCCLRVGVVQCPVPYWIFTPSVPFHQSYGLNNILVHGEFDPRTITCLS